MTGRTEAPGNTPALAAGAPLPAVGAPGRPELPPEPQNAATGRRRAGGRALVVQADALPRADGRGGLPLPDESVDLVVTSPPYFALRSYGAGPGEIGSEATPAEFLQALWQVMAEVKRVLKPSGSAFINLGDTYSRPGGGADVSARSLNGAGRGATARRPSPNRPGVREKSLLGLPWSYALGCTGMLAALGGPDPGLNLILRAEIIADKPNGLPESVRDRVRRSHEQWFHLTRFPRYYSALDEIRTPSTSPRRSDTETAGDKRNKWHADNGVSREDMINPLGALPGSVWRIPSEPLHLPKWLGVDHYASFATEWPRRLILAFSPPGICLACGEGRWPVVDKRQETYYGAGQFRSGAQQVKDGAAEVGWKHDEKWRTESTILGYACNCVPFTDHPGTGEPSGPHARYAEAIEAGDSYTNVGAGWGGKGGLSDRPKVGPWREYHLTGWQSPPTRPAVILDPFGGTGTVGLVARALGRIGIVTDLSHPYCRVARYRIFDSQDANKAITRTNRERQGVLGL